MRRLARGAAEGAVFGGCMALGTVGVATGLLRSMANWAPDPFHPLTLGLSAWTVGVSAGVGGVLALVGGRRLEGRLAHVLPAPFFVGALATGAYPLAEAGAVGVAYLGHLGLRAAWRRWPRVTALVAPTAALGVLAALSGDARPPVAAPDVAAPAHAPNVLWVVFDTVRADHLAIDGYARDTAPHVGALAKEGVVFERAYAAAPWTMPSHASMFTGHTPSRHGCHDQHPFLDDRLPTVAGLLSARGWDTGLLSSNAWVGDATGLDRGFARSVAAWRDASIVPWFPVAKPLAPWLPRDKGADGVDAAFARWLDARDGERPFFAFVNYLEAHTPYHEVVPADRAAFVPEEDADDAIAASVRYERFLDVDPSGPGPSEADRAHLVDLYDAGIHSDDRHLGALLASLDAHGLAEDTLVVVTGDHGEALGDGGRWDHFQGYEEQLHVPLVMRFPGRIPAEARVATDVSLVDLLPTVLDAAGLAADVPDGVEGRSLLALAGGAAAPDRPVYAEGFPNENPIVRRRIEATGVALDAFRWWTVQRGDLRLLRQAGRDRLFDVVADPAAGHDLATERPADVAELRGLVDAFAAGERAVAGDVPEMDAATRARLRDLGYVE